jgi:hypothetical protein
MPAETRSNYCRHCEAGREFIDINNKNYHRETQRSIELHREKSHSSSPLLGVWGVKRHKEKGRKKNIDENI